jgi:hypothetical protein
MKMKLSVINSEARAPQLIEKIIEKPVYIERRVAHSVAPEIKYIERIVEKPIEVIKEVEKVIKEIVYIDKPFPVEKIVTVEKLVEIPKEVFIEKLIEIEKPVEVQVEKLIEVVKEKITFKVPSYLYIASGLQTLIILYLLIRG